MEFTKTIDRDAAYSAFLKVNSLILYFICVNIAYYDKTRFAKIIDSFLEGKGRGPAWKVSRTALPKFPSWENAAEDAAAAMRRLTKSRENILGNYKEIKDVERAQ